MIIYFSGTGNSKFVAEYMADKLSDELIDSAEIIKDERNEQFYSNNPWIFVAPTYGWQIPRIFADFIESSQFDGSKEAFFVLTCGSDIGGAGHYLYELCNKKDLNYRGVLEVVMPENYVAAFPVPNSEKSKKIVEASLPTNENGITLIKMDREFPEIDCTPLDKLKSGFINNIFYSKFVKDKAFYATDKCISCGKCMQLCPTNNITMVSKDGSEIDSGVSSGEFKPNWNGNCTHCMRCICFCPTEAIEYGRRTKNKRRYRFGRD